MKKRLTMLVRAILLILLLNPSCLRAQFFKKLADNVKQVARNKAGDKAGKAADSAVQTKAAGDTSSKTMDSAGLVKAISALSVGKTVSAADSAAAIRSFKESNGGRGILYESRVTIIRKGKDPVLDTSLSYITTEGEGRHEMRFPAPGVRRDKMIILGHAGKPGHSVWLYPESKTYSLMIIDTGFISAYTGDHQVTKIGEESMGGYRCIHSRVVSTIGKSFYKSTTTMDVWTSTEVPGYAVYKKLVHMQQTTSPQLMQALAKAGCEGFFVKMSIEGKNKEYSTTTELIRAEEKSLPAELFRIPPGYTQSDENVLSHMAAEGRSGK